MQIAKSELCSVPVLLSILCSLLTPVPSSGIAIWGNTAHLPFFFSAFAMCRVAPRLSVWTVCISCSQTCNETGASRAIDTALFKLPLSWENLDIVEIQFCWCPCLSFCEIKHPGMVCLAKSHFICSSGRSTANGRQWSARTHTSCKSDQRRSCWTRGGLERMVYIVQTSC